MCANTKCSPNPSAEIRSERAGWILSHMVFLYLCVIGQPDAILSGLPDLFI